MIPILPTEANPSEPTSWLPPRSVRRVLAQVRRSFHVSAPTGRRSLHIQSSFVGLFTQTDLLTLALHSCGPLPGRALLWLSMPYGYNSRRRQRQEPRLQPFTETTAARILGEDLGDALKALQKGGHHG